MNRPEATPSGFHPFGGGNPRTLRRFLKCPDFAGQYKYLSIKPFRELFRRTVRNCPTVLGHFGAGHLSGHFVLGVDMKSHRIVKPPPGCRRCAHRRGWLPYVIVTVAGVEAARRCSCPRGRHLAALDARRDARRWVTYET